ncbi:MAG: hypothetical protein LBC31_01620 [Treponema sp.]|jgi:hypothetical protein|nr:hypothetical protein [Treponema sp.]
MTFPKAFVLILFLSAGTLLSAQTSGETGFSEETGFPQETILQSYERLFIRSSLAAKVNVLQDAATDDQAAEFYGPLCRRALRFVIDNAPLFRDDPDMINITVTAVKGVGENAYSPAADTLWQVFLQFSDNVIRYEILQTLLVLDSPGLTENINRFLAEQNALYGSGVSPDPQMLRSLFAILGKLGNDESYPVLFTSFLMYPGELGDGAVRALYALKGDLSAFLFRVILNNPPGEKLEALRLALGRENLSPGEKGEIGETVMEAGLALQGGRSQARELCRAGAALIRETRWIRALPLALKYHGQTLAAFRADPSAAEDYLDAVGCLASLGSAESARVLALQLGLYNSKAGALNRDEETIVLALVEGLGTLGYRASYDVLDHALRLPYPEQVKTAVRAALNGLTW